MFFSPFGLFLFEIKVLITSVWQKNVNAQLDICQLITINRRKKVQNQVKAHFSLSPNI